VWILCGDWRGAAGVLLFLPCLGASNKSPVGVRESCKEQFPDSLPGVLTSQLKSSLEHADFVFSFIHAELFPAKIHTKIMLGDSKHSNNWILPY
jgi:hypothetical protein